MTTIKGMISGVDELTSKKDATKKFYVVKMVSDGKEVTLSTFDEKAANDAVGKMVSIDYIENGQYKNIKKEGITILTADNVSEEQISDLMENVTDIAKSELVSYVIRRKLIIELLRKMLSYEKSDQYFKENRLHKLFFPMKSDDSSIDYEKHNLWLIDERLAYSYRFFSDEPLKKIFVDSSDSQRPDGLFLDTVSFSDSLNGTASNVTIIEFKKPGRDDYSDKDNPFSQIYKYIDAIKGKTAKGVNGDIINVDDNTKYVAYIIADLTETLKNQMRRQNLKPSSNHDTYFSYNEGYQAFFEVIPYNVILDNSIKRNEVFFKKISI